VATTPAHQAHLALQEHPVHQVRQEVLVVLVVPAVQVAQDLAVPMDQALMGQDTIIQVSFK
jgi:hypothetical protein